MIKEIFEVDYKEKVEQNEIVIMDFYAEWCRPCTLMVPILESVESSHGNVSVFKIDIEKNQKIASEMEITSLPTFIIYKKGTEKERHIGRMSEEELDTIIKNLQTAV